MAATVVSETYDAVLTTTLRNMQPTLRDQVTRSNKLVSFLISRGRRRFVAGGERIKAAYQRGARHAHRHGRKTESRDSR